MTQADVPAACAILNAIIAQGGTTAYEAPFDEAGFAAKHLGGDCLSCLVVEDGAGDVAGFQWLGTHKNLPASCGNIATFTRRDPPLKGAGRALMEETRKAALAAGLSQINATIRADNVPGIGFYTAMGFADHSVTPGVALADGTPVDRVHKRLDLG